MNDMGLFKKKNTQSKSATNSVNQPLNKLINGQLPFGWAMHFKSWYQPKDDAMVAIAVKLSATKDKNQRLELLQSLVDYFYSYKAQCKAQGECFEKYFDNMWMHCSNSRCKDFVYIAPYETELNELKES